LQSSPTGRSDGASAAFLGRRAAPAALVVLSALMFAAVSLRPLSHSELRYVQAGAEMVASGDWVVPHLSYVPYFEKPILAYWLEAASQLAFGTGELAVRLPSLLACVAMVWTTWAWGRALRGPAFGLGAAALLASSVMFQEMGTAVLTDPPFAAFLVFAWYAFWRHDREPESRWIWAFWAALGFSVLTKGPLGPALVGTSIVAYLVIAGRWKDLSRMRLAPGVAVVVAINLPWSVLVWMRDPRFLTFFYLRQNLQALVDEKVNHPGSAFMYLAWFPLVLFPFAVIGVWAAGSAAWKAAVALKERVVGPRAAPRDEAGLYLACSLVVPLLVLSVSASKLTTYILPIFPSVALLAAAWVADQMERPGRVLRFGTTLQGLAMLAGGVVVLAAASRFPERVAQGVETALSRPVVGLFAAVSLLLPMILGGLAMGRGRVVGGMALAGAGAFASLLAVNALGPAFGMIPESTDLVRRLQLVRGPDDLVVVSGPRSDEYAIVRGLGERPYIWGRAAELAMGHFTEVTPVTRPIPDDIYRLGDDDHPFPESPWLLTRRRLKAEWRGPRRVWLVAGTSDLEVLAATGFEVMTFAVNGGTVILTNHPLP
jgi:4-amino-4-deoxy-L-arabinose transferase-like glycosyltransferase